MHNIPQHEETIVKMAEKLKEKGCGNVIVRDIARCDVTEAVADAFRYSKLETLADELSKAC